MHTIPTKTTYLEMHSCPTLLLTPPLPRRVDIHRVVRPTAACYRFLYNSVGSQYLWVDRNRLADNDLQAILDDPRIEIYLLQIDRQPAGYAELDRRITDQVELAYFGLFPQFIGQGLGKYFLGWIVHRAWQGQPRRVWVHTCDLDHPAALHAYLQAGFQIYDERFMDQVVPDGTSAADSSHRPARTPPPARLWPRADGPSAHSNVRRRVVQPVDGIIAEAQLIAPVTCCTFQETRTMRGTLRPAWIRYIAWLLLGRWQR